MNKNELAEKIRILRKAKGLRQDDLAGKAGVSIRVIRDLEGASGNPTIASLDLVASVLGVTLPQILMPGMEFISDLIVDTPRTIKSHGSDNQGENNSKPITSRIFGDRKPENHRNKNNEGQPGKPPHEVSKKINEVIHDLSSDTNKENFSPDRASLILEIQDMIRELSQDDLETLKFTASSLLAQKPMPKRSEKT